MVRDGRSWPIRDTTEEAADLVLLSGMTAHSRPEGGSRFARTLLRRRPRAVDEPIFVNCYGHPLGAAGVRHKLKQYVRAVAH